MLGSTNHRALTKLPRWFENQTRNRPPDRVNSSVRRNILTTQKSPRLLRTWGFLFGAGERNRTLDLLITNELLYQLSYTGDRQKL